MKRLKIYTKNKFLILFLAFTLLLNSCDSLPRSLSQSSDVDTPAAQVWIEFPREGQILDNEAVIFVAYATDAEKVSQVQLSLNGEALPLTSMKNISSDSSNQLARLDQQWTPLANGEYVLKAGNESGAATDIHFCIVTCDAESGNEPDVEVAATNTPVLEETLETLTFTPSSTQTFTGTPTNTPIPTQTKTPVPTRANTPWPTSTMTQTEEYIPPTDTTGPTISSFGTFWEGCTIYGEAYITDPSNAVWAEFWFNHNEQGWAWILMNQTGDQWVSQVGIDTAGLSGNIEYKIRTEDSLFNESWSSVNTMNYEYCGN